MFPAFAFTFTSVSIYMITDGLQFGSLFAWHPTLMLAALAFFIPTALWYQKQRHLPLQRRTWIHATFHSLGALAVLYSFKIMWYVSRRKTWTAVLHSTSAANVHFDGSAIARVDKQLSIRFLSISHIHSLVCFICRRAFFVELIFAVSILGFEFGRDVKDLNNKPHLTTYHAWIGTAFTSLFCLQVFSIECSRCSLLLA